MKTWVAHTYRIEVMVPSWTEYLLAQERMTTSEQKIIDKALALHVGEKPPETRHFLCVNRELHTRHHPVTRSSQCQKRRSVSTVLNLSETIRSIISATKRSRPCLGDQRGTGQ
jgi:hypothetical protein